MTADLMLRGFWLSAGCLLFLLTYNRLILRVQNMDVRAPLIFVTLGSLLGAALGAGVVHRSWHSAWLLAPCGIWLLALGMEIERILIRRACRGSPPLDAGSDRLRLLYPITTRELTVRRYVVETPRWTCGPLRVLQLSDLHINDRAPGDYFRSIVARVKDAAPDMVLISGDFVYRKKSIPLLRETLEGLSAPCGVYAVLGNHDVRAGRQDVTREVSAAGVRVLENDWTRVSLSDGRDCAIVGCQAPWHKAGWPPAGLREAGLPLLCVTHTADNIYMLNRFAPAAVFAGHYHGGQAALPGFGPIVIPSRFGRRFDRGHFQVEGSHLFVSAGIGVTFPQFRVYCPPEIIVVELRGADH